MNLLILVTGIIALFFSGSVFERYRERGGKHLLAWSIGALFYGLAALGEAIVSVGFNEMALKTWYLGGAMLTASWLGQGTVYLLFRKGRIAAILGGILIVLTLVSIVLVSGASVDLSNGFDTSQTLSEQYKDILSRNGITIALTIILNIYGTITLIGGATYSAFIFWRKRTLLHRALGNVLIAVGALLPATGGTSVLAGITDWHNLSLFLGIILIYAGYLVSTPSETEA